MRRLLTPTAYGLLLLAPAIALAALAFGSASSARAGDDYSNPSRECFEFVAMRPYLIVIDHCKSSLPDIWKLHLREIREPKVKFQR